MPFDAWMRQHQSKAQALIARFVPQAHPLVPQLHEAMHYAAALGGKRVRPLLVWAAGECVQADAVALDRAACAVELVHAYSLVHDDLPCMDDDVLRRGQPTTHVRFGEALALLAGDALQALAYEVLTPDVGVAPALQARLCALLARASGADGMAGGQTLDILATGGAIGGDDLMHMHSRKTGALLKASVLMGAACGGVISRHDPYAPPSPSLQGAAPVYAALDTYGEAIGLAFQVVDDILDVTADSATLGKTAGKDAQQNKSTYVSALGLDAARQLAHDLRDKAQAALDTLPAAQCASSQRLRELADLIVLREH
ncbi:MAG: polyprenyl synthetase [Thiomonas sp. 20-64-5]|nr:MAG: polyprenyl synthetase [Thiomonas sp. 20-64-5]